MDSHIMLLCHLCGTSLNLDVGNIDTASNIDRWSDRRRDTQQQQSDREQTCELTFIT